MKKIELLAPAGSFEALKAAIAYGADAVYLGGKQFGARAFAHNFNHEELKEAVNLAHIYGVKIYVTMNTLLNDYELANARKEIAFLYSINVDALIIQDLGLYTLIRDEFPDFEIHASTQMHIHNLAGVKVAKRMGFKRIVVARETKLKDIEMMCREGIEIETFIHGALCISYSGQCLFSSSLFKRSGNKGSCAQCCRLPYKLYDYDTLDFVATDRKYLLSPHDLMTLNDISALIEAGIASLKIEGRMKKAGYVGYITALYRQAIDAYYKRDHFKLDKEKIDNMKVLFNRGFTDAYLYKPTAQDIYANEQPNHRGIYEGSVLDYKNKQVKIKLARPLNQFDGIRFSNNEGMIVNKLYDRKYKLAAHLPKGEIAYIDTDKVNKNTPVFLTLDSKLEQSILDNLKFPAIPIKVSFVGKINENLKLSIDDDTNHIEVISAYKADKAINSPLTKNDILEAFDHLKNTAYRIDYFDCDIDDHFFVPIKYLKELRREAIQKLNLARIAIKREVIKTDLPIMKVKHLDTKIIKIDSAEKITDAVTISEDEIADYLIYPLINPDSKYKNRDYVVISELGALLNEAKHKIAYYTLNVSNARAVRFLFSLGFEAVIVSTELNKNERNILANNLTNEYKSHFLYSGKRDLMNLALSPLDCLNVDKSHHYALVYKNKYFPINRKINRFVIQENENQGEIDENFYPLIEE